MKSGPILFVGHDAVRAGSEMQLLHFLRWFAAHGNRPFSLLLGGGGELMDEYAELTDVWSVDGCIWRSDALRSKLLEFARMGGVSRSMRKKRLQRFGLNSSPLLIYANSIASAPIVELLETSIPMIVHVHELETWFRRCAGLALRKLIGQTRRFIACSEAVREHLVQVQGIDPARIDTVHESIPVAAIRARRGRNEMLDEMSLPGHALLVLGCGTADWRKGADLFIQTAHLVCQKRPDVFFVWVGARTDQQCIEFEYDVRAMGLSERVVLKRSVPRAADYIGAADVFLLPSREDPFPLVCLEAAALGKPIICFAGAGGMPEFVGDDCGFVVPYLDVNGMASRVLTLLDRPECRDKMGAAAQRKVVQRHDIGTAGRQILDIIERMIASA